MMETFLGIEFYTWGFLLVGAVFSGYAILDGFDLGIGTLHLFLKNEKHRQIALHAISPVWLGNEVWLVIGGGVLFACFPKVYATLLSAFYLPVIFLLVLLILRGIAIEFRNKEPLAWWRRIWDFIFSLSSTLIGFTLGVLLGNIVWGVTFEKDLLFYGGFTEIFNPYAILTGITVVTLFTMHGAIYLVMKTESQLYERLRSISTVASRIFIISYFILTAFTLIYVPRVIERFLSHPSCFAIPVLTLLVLINGIRLIEKRKFWMAFVSSAGIISLLLITIAIGLFPNLLYSNLDPSYSLTIENSSSSEKSLRIILLFVIIGAPLVLIYTVFLFKTFRGKVSSDEYL